MKKSEKHKHPLTVRGIGPGGKFSVIIPWVSTPNDKYPQTPNKMYNAVIEQIANEKMN